MIRLGSIEFPTYFFVISFAFCVAVYWLAHRASQHGLSRKIAIDTGLAVMIGGFIGARLTHILYEAPGMYWAEPVRVLKFWEGGFVWYGGAVAGFLAGAVFLKLSRSTLRVWLDVFAPIAAGGYTLGRVACLLTGCCYGAVCVLSNGFSFRYPTQGLAVVWESFVVLLLLWIEKRRDRFAHHKFFNFVSVPGSLFAVWIFMHATGRLIMEGFRADDRGPALGPLSLSMIISIVLVAVSLAWLNDLRHAGKSK